MKHADLVAAPPSGDSAVPSDELRQKCGDVLLVGGTFFLDGARLVLKNGISFPVEATLKISRRGITFPKVQLSKAFRDVYGPRATNEK
jgi:hypothetical protein